MRVVVALCATCLLSIAATADAGRVYRWTDAKGIAHYDGRRPDLPDDVVTAIPFHAEPGAMARLRLVQDDDGGTLVIADNTLAGPIEVIVDRDPRGGAQAAIVAEPALPARATVPAGGSVVVSKLQAAGPMRGGSVAMQLQAVPGSSNARPEDFEYAYPLQTPDVRVEQGWGGAFSHADVQNHYAVDFAADLGTPVLAARDGVVMQLESDFDQASLSAERFGGRANFVRVLHDDGTMAVYAHLQPEGALVRVGQRVRKGQVIGLSGNTGFTTGPHLHFVLQVNRGMELQSIPFRMFSGHGILRFAESR